MTRPTMPASGGARRYKGGKQIDTMTPVRRFYKASQQTSTMPDIRSSLNEDLYLVFEGLNQDNGHPFSKRI